MNSGVVFRCDAGAAIGGGHVMRCLALADAFAADGWDCAFATRPETRDLVPTLPGRFPVLWLDGDPSDEPAQIAAQLATADVLVVDHYGRDAAFERACRGYAARIIALDDAPTRNHACDLLVCPTPPWTARDFAARLPTASRVLAGPAYAPLRPAFSDRRFARRAHTDAPVPQRVLIAFGASDPANASGRVLAALAEAGLTEGLTVDVMLGRAMAHRTAVEARAARLPGVQLHIDPADPAALIARADLAIGAAGTMAWERCSLGVASVLVSIADNQLSGSAFLAQAGAALDIGSLDTLADEDLVAAVRGLLDNDDERARMAAAAAALCDGLGAQRLVAAMAPPRAADGAVIFLRPATMDDSALILDWQCHPDTRRFARNPAPPDRATHTSWMTRTLRDPYCILSLIEHGEDPAGVVRLNRLDGDGDAEIFEVSILVAPEFKRLGIARAALDLAHRLRPAATLLARVLPDNAASHALFRGAGYEAHTGGYRKQPLRAPLLEAL